VPLTVRFLSGERYGAWATISSVFAFLSLTDFGQENTPASLSGTWLEA
jgi:hypothetical protein